MADASGLIAQVWFKHRVKVEQPGVRNALGVTTGGQTHEVLASVDAQARTVMDQQGQEVTAAATVQWHVDGVLPQPGWLVTLPAAFGLKPGRRVVTARRVTTGTGLTPDYVEVTVQ